MAKTNNVYKFEVILTTFEVLLQDVELLSKPFWKYLVIDEAHRLKVKKYLGDFKIVRDLTTNIEQAISIVRDFAKLPQRASFVVDRHAFAKQYWRALDYVEFYWPRWVFVSFKELFSLDPQLIVRL